MKTLVILIICILFSAIANSQIPVAKESVIQLKTVVTEDPPSISFYWNEISYNSVVVIFRKKMDYPIWKVIHTTLPGDTNYSDKNVTTGLKYEYKVALLNNGILPTHTYVIAGIRCQEKEIRKKIILLVDNTLVDSLEFELSRLEADLIGDGWEIIRNDISRYSSVKQVKELIDDIYYSNYPNVNTLFLVGHIPVPYSGEFAFDGHKGEHDGAWPADVYYGALNPLFWTDYRVNNTNSKYPENHNLPGDGKYDISNLEKYQTVDLAIGRVDFYNLPAFPQSEIELMRNYLDKDHAYRQKKIKPKMQALIDDNLPALPVGLDGDTVMYELMAISGWRNFTALFNFENVKTGKIFQDAIEDSYLWTYGCGWGKLDECDSIGKAIHFADYAPNTVFTGFYGSWFGDWNTPDNFLRAALASNGWILTSYWSGRPHYIFHHMGMGETLAAVSKEHKITLTLTMVELHIT